MQTLINEKCRLSTDQLKVNLMNINIYMNIEKCGYDASEDLENIDLILTRISTWKKDQPIFVKIDSDLSDNSYKTLLDKLKEHPGGYHISYK